MEFWEVISWIALGLVAGGIAKWIRPGKQGGGWLTTLLLGIVGAVVGGWIFSLFGGSSATGFNFRSLIVAVVGALVVPWIWGLVTKKKS